MLHEGVGSFESDHADEHLVPIFLILPVRIVRQLGRLNVPEGHGRVLGYCEGQDERVDCPDVILAHLHGNVEVLSEAQLQDLQLIRYETRRSTLIVVEVYLLVNHVESEQMPRHHLLDLCTAVIADETLKQNLRVFSLMSGIVG